MKHWWLGGGYLPRTARCTVQAEGFWKRKGVAQQGSITQSGHRVGGAAAGSGPWACPLKPPWWEPWMVTYWVVTRSILHLLCWVGGGCCVKEVMLVERLALSWADTHCNTCTQPGVPDPGCTWKRREGDERVPWVLAQPLRNRCPASFSRSASRVEGWETHWGTPSSCPGGSLRTGTALALEGTLVYHRHGIAQSPQRPRLVP